MGFFSKLFDKKICDVCGSEIGLFGNRKLEDGNLCKECAAKLSPWFSDRRSSTVEEIKKQLDYREANRQAVADFRPSRIIGEDVKVYIDEKAGKFMITSADNLEEANPDVLSLNSVTDCQVNIREERDEVMKKVRNKDGETEKESYSPKRYNYSYRFSVKVRVNNPYFDEMEFNLTGEYIEVEASKRRSFSPFGFNNSADNDFYAEGSIEPPTLEDRRSNLEYAKYENMGAEIREALLDPGNFAEREDEKEECRENTPPSHCPWCGEKVEGNIKFCPCCGGKLTE